MGDSYNVKVQEVINETCGSKFQMNQLQQKLVDDSENHHDD